VYVAPRPAVYVAPRTAVYVAPITAVYVAPRTAVYVAPRVYVPVVRTVTNYYSPSYLNSAAYLISRKSFNYGLCSTYGYYNYNCIGYGTYTYSYWEPSMLSLCL
jgi:hypothetical protein